MNKEDFLTQTGRAFELLGNPLRLKIFLSILAQGCDCDIHDQSGLTGNCVTGIMRELKLPQSTVSTYIKDLSDGGLIDCAKKGRFLYCRPSRSALLSLKTFVDSALSQVRP